uniref:PilW family protein n=1 Tax=Marinospirillum sp. TaxID=2183934 RepID=UPI003A84418F
MPARQDQQLGLGLVEMLVTALIGGILLVSIATAISAMTQTQNRIDEYERLQESLRFVIHLAGRSL